ncbi:MAG: SIMPL domain-containing protein [Deltaproteobacteria bacterium]|nr:SIMPL domain-containing protein [Deltaproteobacteria bacterium]
MENKVSALIIGLALFGGLIGMALLLGNAALSIKERERSVNVKGLAERELPADVVIWPIQFTAADNNLQKLYLTLADNAGKIRQFLIDKGLSTDEITVNPPAITDKSAQSYGGSQAPEFRYSALQTVTVYSGKVDQVRALMSQLTELGREGIVFNSDNYEARPEYIFTRLNEIKPAMIEEATRKARDVALKFAADSSSRLGKIRQASQGQFSISDRDKSTPYIKRIRVVSTVEYYLAD